MNTRSCADCGADISARHPAAYLCIACGDARIASYQRKDLASGRAAARARARWQRIKADPLALAAYRAKQAADTRAKRATRVLEVVKCEDGCGRTFQMNRTGRRRRFHPRCAAFYGGYRSVKKYLETKRSAA